MTGDEDAIAGVREVLGGTSSKVTSSSSSSSSSSSTADGGAEDTYGEDTGPYGDNYGNYGNYETYYDEITPSPDTSKTVSVSVDTGSVVDLGLAGKIELGAGTGAGSSKVVTSSSGSSMTINRTKITVSGRPGGTQRRFGDFIFQNWSR